MAECSDYCKSLASKSEFELEASRLSLLVSLAGMSSLRRSQRRSSSAHLLPPGYQTIGHRTVGKWMTVARTLSYTWKDLAAGNSVLMGSTDSVVTSRCY